MGIRGNRIIDIELSISRYGPAGGTDRRISAMPKVMHQLGIDPTQNIGTTGIRRNLLNNGQFVARRPIRLCISPLPGHLREIHITASHRLFNRRSDTIHLDKPVTELQIGIVLRALKANRPGLDTLGIITPLITTIIVMVQAQVDVTRP